MKKKKLTFSPPLLVDTNAFGHLFDRTSADLILNSLEKNDGIYAQQLYIALRKRNMIYHETLLLENLGLPQTEIHTNERAYFN
jgi:hypothetical protein